MRLRWESTDSQGEDPEATESDRECHRAEEGIFSLSGIEPGMLHDDAHVRVDETGVIGIQGYGRGMSQIIEPDMFCSPGWNLNDIGSNRLAVCIKDCDLYRRILI